MKKNKRTVNLKFSIFLVLISIMSSGMLSDLSAQTYIEHADIVDKSLSAIQTHKSFIAPNGHVYILSITDDASIMTTDGSTFSGNLDVLYTHYDDSGNVVTTAYIGGTGIEVGVGIHVDASNTVILVCQTNSTDFPVMGGGSHAAHGLGFQLTRTIFDGSGQMVFSDYVTEDNQQGINPEVMLADDGNGTFFMAWMSPQTLGFGLSNLALMKFDNNGPALSSTLLPSTNFINSPLTLLAQNGLVFLSHLEGFPGAFTYTYRKFDYQLDQLFSIETGTAALAIEGDYIYEAGNLNVDLGFPSTDGSSFVSGSANLVVSKRNIFDNSISYLSYVGPTVNFAGIRIVVDAGDVYVTGWESPGGIASTDGTVVTGGSSMFYMKKNTSGVTQYISYYGGSGEESVVSNSVEGDFLWIGGVTSLSTDFPTTDGTFLTGSDDNQVMIKVDKNTGEVMLANTFGVVGDDAEVNSGKVPGGFVYTGRQEDILTDIIPVTNSAGPVGGSYYAKLSICPTNYTFSTTLSPSVQNVCQNGLVSQIVGETTFIDGSTLPTLYEHGIPITQPDVAAEYQWQEASAVGGPWMDIPGAISQHYSPDPTVTDKFYQRVDRMASCCGGNVINTTDVSSILVNGFVAPFADAGGIYNSCPGLMESVGATPLATGGTMPYTYEWFEGDSEVAFSVLENPMVSTGVAAESFVYTAIVTDANNCKHIDQAVLNVHEADAGVDVGFCEGSTGVKIGGSPIPGVAGVVYTWSPVAGLSCTDCAQPIANPIVATTYTLMLTIPRSGGGTCSSTDDVLVTPVLAPTTGGGAFAGPDKVMCLGDVITIGFAPEAGFGYTWASGNYLVDNMVAEATVQTGNLTMPTPNPIIYYLTAEKEGCLFVDDVEVAAIEARADIDGCGPRTVGLIDRTPNITENYAWSIVSGGGTFQGANNEAVVPVTASPAASPTTYHLDVTYNGHTCTDEVFVPVCGCVVNITVEAPFVCPDFSLNGGDVTLIATAATTDFSDPDYFTYTWSPAVGLSSTTGRVVTLTDDVQRTYTVTMSDPNGSAFTCFETIEVNQPAWSLPVFDSPNVTTCPGMPIQIGDALVAGYSYEWRGDLGLTNYVISDPIATVNSTTIFEVTITDLGSGCITIDETLVDLGNIFADAGPDHLVCDNGVVTLGNPGVAGGTYAWTPVGSNWQNGTDENTANPDVLVGISTTFDLVVTDLATGCTSTDQVEVIVGTGIPPFSMADIVYCPSTSGPLNLGVGAPVAGIVSYSWSPAFFLDDPTVVNPMVTTLPNSEIVFTLVVTNADGCEQISNQTIIPTITPPIVGGNKSLCLGDVTTIGSASNSTGAGISYLWTPATGLSDPTSPNPTLTAITAGFTAYSLTKTEAGCDVTLTVDVNIKEYVLPDMAPVTICEGACVSIGVPNDASASYIWTPEQGIATLDAGTTIVCPIATTVYTLTAQGANGCLAEKDVFVSLTLPAAPTLTIADPGVQCLGTTGVSFSTSVLPAGGYDYTWSPNDGTLSDIYSDSPGVVFASVGMSTYSLSVTDPSTGCVTEDIAELSVVDCALIPLHSIGNLVWIDSDNDGVKDISESTLGGITVVLHYVDPASGVLTMEDSVITDANGLYLFDSLIMGEYIVEIPGVVGNPVLTGMVSSSGSGPGVITSGINEDASNPIDPDGDIDNDDNGVLNGSPMFVGSFVSDTLSLGGNEPINDLNPDNDFSGALNENSNLTVDFGFVLMHSIGNQIWSDEDNNGLIDVGESFVEGVLVELHYYDPIAMLCVLVDSDSTDMNGLYLFDTLTGGDYIIVLPASNFGVGGALEGSISSTGGGSDITSVDVYEDGVNPLDADTDIDGDDNGIMDGNAMFPGAIVSDTLTLAENEAFGENPNNDNSGALGQYSNLTVDFGIVQLRSIGNQVWLDVDNDGLFDLGEDGIEGVSVVLHYVNTSTGSCDVIDTVLTDVNGFYLFDTLLAGQYIVEIPSVNNTAGVGSLDGLVSSTGSGLGQIADGVFEDAMNQIDPNLDVNLDDNGVLDGNAMFVGSVVSDTIDLGNNEPLLEGDTAPDMNNDGSGALDSLSNLSLDFGFTPLMSIGNQVWVDSNNDGIINSSETGLEGVSVILHRYDAVLMVCVPIDTVLTDANGQYLFEILTEGDYIIELPSSNFANGSVADGYTSSTGGFSDLNSGPYEDDITAIDPDDNINLDDNGVMNGNSMFAVGSIASDTLTLSYGNEPLVEGNSPEDMDNDNSGATDNNSNLTVDFGLTLMHSIGNQVWADANNNGIVDAGESSVEGVLVELHYYDPITMLCVLVDTDSTDLNGLYLFDTLIAGDYIIVLPASNFGIGGTLEGSISSTGGGSDVTSVGTYEDGINPLDADTDIDGDDNGILGNNAMFPGAVVSDTLTLAENEPFGENPNNDNSGALGQNSNLTVDFGIVQLHSIGNQVWLDVDNDGVFDLGEDGIEGVSVVLHYVNSATGSCDVIDTVLTDVNGFYLFDTLIAGQYIVEIPSINNTVGVGSLDGLVSSTGSGLGQITDGVFEDAMNQIDPNLDINLDDNGVLDGNVMFVGSVVSDTIDLGNNEPLLEGDTAPDMNNDGSGAADSLSNLSIDFGFTPLMSIGNQVWVDTNNDGVINSSEIGLAGISVILHRYDPVLMTCLPVDTVLTDANGQYLFANLTEGDYILELPSTNFANGSVADGYTSSTGGFSDLTSGPYEDDLSAIDPDDNINLDDNGVMNGNSMFAVGSIASDTLTLSYGNEPLTEGTSPQDTDNDSSGATDNNSNLSVDFGLTLMYSIGNTVWFDENDNGIIDGTESGLAGVQVILHYYDTLTMTCFPLDVVLTDLNGLYLFDTLIAGQYMVEIPSSELGAGGPLQDYQSTTGTFNMGGIYEDVNTPISGDSDIDSDDNGVFGLNPNFPLSVLSDTLTLGDVEPLNELPNNDVSGANDENSNLTLDFGFVDKVYDIALTKATMMMTGNSFGDTILFMIEVTNQGNVPLTNVEVTDYIPGGFAYVPGLNDPLGWTDNLDMTAQITLPDTILPNGTVQVNYYLMIMMSDMSGAFVNYAEVSEFQDTIGNSTDGTGPYVGGIQDIDSTPDNDNTNDAGGSPESAADDYIDGNGTGIPGDEVAATDEDDHDPALIEVVDVALLKTIAPGQAPFEYGKAVLFNVDVINQGNVDLYNVEITDYIPSGFTYDTIVSNALGWTYDGVNATIVLQDSMVMWDTVKLQISLIPIALIPSVDGDAWTNVAEVSQLFNRLLVDISGNDIDSQSDNDPANDPGGEPNTGSDDTVNGDGNHGGGNPGDTNEMTDEDDSDPALVPIFDLALTKQLVFPDSVYVFGDEIEFMIVLQNQGNVPATNIEVTDYIPGALTNVGATNTIWSFGGTTATYVYTDTLLPIASDTIYLNMIFQRGLVLADYVNYAEISEAADTLGNNTTNDPILVHDADSTPDSDNTNDAGGQVDSAADDFVDGNGTGVIGDGIAETDEDDHDPVLVEFVDMAIVKTLMTTGPVSVGQDVVFEIEVINQGVYTMVDIMVIDYIPNGFALSVNDTNGWTLDVDGNARNVVSGPLGFEESDTIEIILTVQSNATTENLVNTTELVEYFFETGGNATSDDVDSQGDTIPTNDGGGMIYTDSDDAVDGDGTGTPGDSDPTTDEDDADPAVPDVHDLSLIKYTDHITPVRAGDVVTFEMEVCNQGNIPVEGITIEDRIPAGFVLASPDPYGWNVIDVSTVSYTISDRLLRDSCTIVMIDMEVLPNVAVEDLVNVSEIFSALDTLGNDISGFDLDSDPNNDNGEAEETLYGADDDSTSGSVPNGEDSDDADPAAPPVFDLALRKTNTVVGPSTKGDIVPFEIIIYNQGNVPATNITVTDYIPAGLAFVNIPENIGWIPATGADYEYNYAGVLAPFTTDTIEIHLEILLTATPFTVVNMAEISQAFDTFGIDHSLNDIDGNLDAINDDKGNDIYSLEDDKLDESGLFGDDEDDHDQAYVNLCEAIVCKSNLNISLDETCASGVTPAMLLLGDLFPDFLYEITAVDENGNPVDPQQFSGDDVGKTFMVTICNTLCENNCCMMSVTIEDKFPPQIECVSDTITCAELINFPEPIVTENCSNYELVMLNETFENVDCNDPELQQIITRTWKAVDAAGNESNVCSQTLSISKFDIGTVDAPVNLQIDLECGVAYAEDASGNPDPIVYGSPQLAGNDLWPGQFLVCNLMVNYSDQTIPTSQNTISIVRTWSATTWYCGVDSTRIFVQVFNISDTQGPEMSCPGDMSLSSSGIDCTADVILPTIDIVDLCGTVVDVDVQYEGGFIENSNGGLAHLPKGTSVVTYTATDSNGNISSCSFNVTVSDNEQPIPVCEQFTTISLTNDGTSVVFASMFDDGSFDACGPVTLEVRRMNADCDPTDIVFGESITFCCADLGVEQMVVLRVTDASGNYNECMVMAEVQDKIPPVLVQGLPDITLSCEFPFNVNDTEQFGSIVMDVDDIEAILLTADSVAFSGPAQDGLVLGNCIELISDEFSFSNINDCGTGSATRVLTFANADGITVTDIQFITFVNPSPFVESNITWPGNYSFTNLIGMNETLPANMPTGFDFPTFVEDGCDQVAFDYDDQVVDDSNGAECCYKIIRTWTVADWCQNNNGVFFTWEHHQTITVTNTVAPVITGDCTDREVCSYDENCGPVYIELINDGTDDCTDSTFLNWTYSIDLFSDGSIEIVGNTLSASGTYPVGFHTIYWTLNDGCNNADACSYTFDLKNCKPATPICLDNLTVGLTPVDTDGDNIPDTEMVTISASYFDGGSYHVCGTPIQLSFSPDVADTLRTYDCDDIGEQPIELWVTDANGNQDYCTTTIDVQDNNNVDLCPAMLSVDVTGEVYTENDEMIAKSIVVLEGAEMTYDTEEDGYYGFLEMPTGNPYTVIPGKNTGHLNGITTLDIVKIQKHILGISTLDSPYKLIAADVNHSDNISGVDIIQLRKLLLGLYDELPDNTSWRFIDADHEFIDPTNPWISNIPEEYTIQNLDSDMIIDFRGVKIGDVNNSALPNALVGHPIDTRSGTKLELIVEEGELTVGTHWIPVYADNFDNMVGMQLGLKSKLSVLDVRGGELKVSASNYSISEDGASLSMIWTNGVGETISRDKVLFEIQVQVSKSMSIEDVILISDEVMRNESYNESLEVNNVTIDIRRQGSAIESPINIELAQNEPNPWMSTTSIQFSSNIAGNGTLRILDVAGQVLSTKPVRIENGVTTFLLSRDELPVGVLYYELELEGNKYMKKMVLIK